MAIRSSSEFGKVWKFSHDEDEYMSTNILGVDYLSADGFLEITPDGTIAIFGTCDRGYAWDGCTPKWELLDFTIGTPDGRFDYLTQKPMTYYASMFHDILYQNKKDLPISRLVVDKLFYKVLKESGFMWAGLYYFVVRVVGLFLGKWKVKTKVKDLRIVEASWINKAYEEYLRLRKKELDNHSIVKTARRYKETTKKMNGGHP